MKFTVEVNAAGCLPELIRPRIAVVLKGFAGKTVDVEITRHRDKRSLDQNAYWHAVPVDLLAEHCGYTHDQMHYALLGEWGGYLDGPAGQPVPRIASSSKLTTDEFSKLIEWVLTWGPSEMGVIIPAPNEVTV